AYDLDVASSQKKLRQMPRREKIEDLEFGAKEKTIMPEADFRLLQIANQSRSMPALTDASISDATFRIAQNEARRPILPQIASAEAAKAQAEGVDAKNSVQLGEIRRKAQEAQLALGTKMAELQAS